MKYVLLALAGILALTSTAQAADTVEGYWLTQNERAVVKISPCADSVCGKVYWIIDGGLQYDEHNPDEAMRTRPMCGLQILGDFEKAGENAWDSGYIYKADEGDMYAANIALQDDGTLKLRGYMGISLLGKTQVWNRVNPSDYKACRAPS
ncbi:MAG: DUF2147 domain-containing protein [Alphaproteobacteria bacterium]|nr:DUF2147 domain-containing protein [Alphaproteobacteria bacterium]